MPSTTCKTCHHTTLTWSWTEAFDKFGFDDGDGQVVTETVADVLRAAGYVVSVEPWGWHNVVITSIMKDGVEQIPTQGISFGYDAPRSYLPDDIITLLDQEIPDQGEVAT